jgi:LysM repeat protein
MALALTPALAAPAARALHFTRRGRVVVLLALIVVLFVAFSSLRVAIQAGTASTGSATHTLTVHPGETLWQIARQVAPSDDPRDTVDRIRDLNNLDTSVVQAGQRLIVPN